MCPSHADFHLVTLSLNASLHTHSQTLALLALQRSTANLPFQLISPGRTFIKRGPLFQIERGEQPKEREFLLFSDCLLWLASEESEYRNWGLGAYLGNNGSTDYLNARPPMVRTRSKSDADVSRLQARAAAESVGNSGPSRPSGTPKAQRSLIPPPSSRIKRHGSQANAGDERWTYKGRASLVDLEVIVSPAREPGEERRLEVLSPEGSFVLFADTEPERDEWAGAIRTAKAQLLVSLNVTHPNSTLTSSASTNHGEQMEGCSSPRGRFVGCEDRLIPACGFSPPTHLAPLVSCTSRGERHCRLILLHCMIDAEAIVGRPASSWIC